MDITDALLTTLGTTVEYSRCGGGAGSWLLLKTDNRVSINGWGCWEIWRYDEILATSEDDDTAIVGKMAQAAIRIEGKKTLGFTIDEQRNIGMLFEDALELWLFYVPECGHEELGLIFWEIVYFPSKISFTLNSRGALVTEFFYE